LGYPLPSWPRHFLAGLTVFSRRRPPIPCETGFILSYALRLFRVLPSVPAPGSPLSEALKHARSVLAELLPWGCLPSSRRQPAASLRRSPSFATFRPRRFARPRRFHPPLTLRVYFTPLPRPGFRPSGISPPSTAESIRHRSVPSRRLASVTCKRLPVRASFLGPALRALHRARSPLRLRQFYPAHRPIPSWAFSSSRCSLFRPSETPSCPLPPMAFRRFRESSPMTFSVLPV